MIFGEPGNWKTLVLPGENNVFRKISCPPTGKVFDWFSIPKLLQNLLNLASKRYCFLTSFSERILMIFASNLEVQKPLNFEKIDAFGQRWWWICSGSALGFDFGAISRLFGTKFDGFCVQMCSKSQDLLRIFMQSPRWACCRCRAARLSEQPVLMIRATSSRSTRPNHMSNQIDSPKALRLGGLRLGAGDMNSVAKQAPFCIAFRAL